MQTLKDHSELCGAHSYAYLISQRPLMATTCSFRECSPKFLFLSTNCFMNHLKLLLFFNLSLFFLVDFYPTFFT